MLSMQLNKFGKLGGQLAPMRNAVLLDGSGCQALQRRVLELGDNLVQRLASQQLSERSALRIDGIQMGSSIEQCRDHIRLGRLVQRGHVEGQVVVVISVFDVSSALDQEADHFGGGKLADGVSAHC